MDEQDWLLLGDKVNHVIFDVKGKPCRIIAPDPRYFALQKMWLSNKPSRNKLKVEKDYQQGLVIMDLVHQHIGHYPLDDAFEHNLPEELKQYFNEWKSSTKNTPSQLGKKIKI